MNPILRAYATPILLTAIVILIAGLALFGKVQTARLDAEKAAFSAYRAEVESLGREAEKARQRDILDRKAISDKQEADNAKRIASLDLRYRAALATARLSKPDSGSGGVPALSTAAPQFSCPDRSTDVAGRLAELEVGVLSLLERGDKAIERTITCKAWLDEQAAR